MTKLDPLDAKIELLQTVWLATNNKDLVTKIALWWENWIKEISVTHSISRELMNSGNINSWAEAAHGQMYYEIAESIKKGKLAIIETEVDTDDEGRQNQYTREDRMTVLILGPKKND